MAIACEVSECNNEVPDGMIYCKDCFANFKLKHKRNCANCGSYTYTDRLTKRCRTCLNLEEDRKLVECGGCSNRVPPDRTFCDSCLDHMAEQAKSAKEKSRCKNPDCFNKGKQIYRGYCMKCCIRLNQPHKITNIIEPDMQTVLKFDQNKLPYDLIPYDALDSVVSVLRYGAKKYSPRNWENGIEYSRLFGAAQRHAKDFFQYREEVDKDSGLHPIAHAICNLLFLLALHKRGYHRVFDDRPLASTTQWLDKDENPNPKTDKDIEPF